MKYVRDSTPVVRVGAWMLLLTMAWPAFVPAGNWQQWRGPRGSGVSPEQTGPLRWSALDNVRWSTPIAGRGYSSPIVYGNRVFVTTATALDLQGQTRQSLVILDRDTGQILHETHIARDVPGPKQEKNSYATATPVTDGTYVYCCFGKWGVACLDYDGKIVWTSYPGDFNLIHGEASSPILYQDMVLLARDQDGQSYLVALEKATGRIRWKRYRRTERSFTTPILMTVDGRDQFIVSGGRIVAGYDPHTGLEIWRASDVVNKWVVPSVISGQGLVFASSGASGRMLLAIDPTGSGDITETHIRWKNPRGATKLPSPLYHDGLLYSLGDSAILTTLDAKTGKRVYQKRISRNFSFKASPLLVGEYLYCVSENGTTFVIRAGKTFEVLAKNHLDEPTSASPALSDGQLFIRTERQLYCIEEK